MGATIARKKGPSLSKAAQDQQDLVHAQRGEAAGNGHAKRAKPLTTSAADAAAEAAMNAGDAKYVQPAQDVERFDRVEEILVPIRTECRVTASIIVYRLAGSSGWGRWRWSAKWTRRGKAEDETDVEASDAFFARSVAIDRACDYLLAELGTGRDNRIVQDIEALRGRIADGDDGPAVLADVPASDAQASVEAAVTPPDAVAEELVTLALDEIVFSALNPRKHFDQAELQNLAASIKSEGLIQKPLVRPLLNAKLSAPRYELVDGERRIRAARLAGLTHVGVVVREMTDDEAAARRGIANLKRKDLNAVEEAGWLKELLAQRTDDGAPRYTQDSLAATLGFTQSWVANRLRLLELPKPWQERLISGAITPSHAREVLVYKDWPELQAAIEKKIGKNVDRDVKAGEEPASVHDFADEVWRVVRHETYPLSGQEYGGQAYDYKSANWKMRPTEAERAALGIVPVHDRGDKLEDRALNRKVWAPMAAKAKREALEALKANKGTGKKGKAAATKPEQRTPAEQKRIDKQRADVLERNRLAWRFGWLQYLCARAITNPMPLTAMQKTLGWRLVVWCATVNVQGGYDRDEHLADLLECGCRRGGQDEAWGAMRHLSADELLTLSRRLLAKWLCDLSEAATPVPGNTFDEEEVEWLAADLTIDLAHAWRNDLPESMAAEFFEMHDKTQLVKLGKEWGVHVDEGKTKPQMIQQLRAAPRALPKVIDQVKAPAAGSKPSKKRKAK